MDDYQDSDTDEEYLDKITNDPLFREFCKSVTGKDAKKVPEEIKSDLEKFVERIIRGSNINFDLVSTNITLLGGVVKEIIDELFDESSRLSLRGPLSYESIAKYLYNQHTKWSEELVSERKEFYKDITELFFESYLQREKSYVPFEEIRLRVDNSPFYDYFDFQRLATKFTKEHNLEEKLEPIFEDPKNLVNNSRQVA